MHVLYVLYVVYVDIACTVQKLEHCVLVKRRSLAGRCPDISFHAKTQ